uniref:Transmembrane protein n=1 Tax=Globodera rostochiensis TaxID=31243 RepID=A0A914GS32_GLORO
MPLKLDSSFELAFRRAVFSLLLLLAHLVFSSLVLSLLGQFEWAKRTAHDGKQPQALQRSRRMDFERRELISTLWAESVAARSESDWSLVANAKLDAYERLLASESDIDGTCAAISSPSSSNPWTFPDAMRTTFMAITTMGGGVLTETVPPRLGPATKLKSSTFGLLAVFSGIVLIAAIIVDIVLVEDEEHENENSFLDSLFTVLLAFGTISGHSLRHFSLFLLIPFSIVLLAVSGLIFSSLQRAIERWLAPHEFAFANGICGQIERAVSGARLNEEHDEEEEGEDDEFEQHQHHPGLQQQRNVQFEFGDCSYATDSSTNLLLTTTPFGGGRRSVVGQTIREDDEEQHSPSNIGDDADQ